MTLPNDTPTDAPVRRRILIVDDQPINIRVMHMMLARDYQVFMATSGEQALALCAANLPDLVLMDVVMPGMDGYEACRRLKAEAATRDIRVVFVTAHDDPQQQALGRAAGADGFITKPVDPQKLLATVAEQLTGC